MPCRRANPGCPILWLSTLFDTTRHTRMVSSTLFSPFGRHSAAVRSTVNRLSFYNKLGSDSGFCAPHFKADDLIKRLPNDDLPRRQLVIAVIAVGVVVVTCQHHQCRHRPHHRHHCHHRPSPLTRCHHRHASFVNLVMVIVIFMSSSYVILIKTRF
jgi:hypothetical protein